MSNEHRWKPRTVPPLLVEQYVRDGWWTDDTLGGKVGQWLTAAPTVAVHIHSRTNEWHGTYADIDHEARRVVALLREEGIEPGAVVAFQLPNWREAVVAFYALAMGGYVLVPIVHIYGHKEVRFILGESGARAYISSDRFGHVDYFDVVDGAPPGELADPALHVVVPSGPDSTIPRSERVTRVAWETFTDTEPADTVSEADADDVCVLAYTSGTTSAPKGVMHTHRTLLAELLHMRPWMTPGAPNLMGSPVTHATGMLGAVLSPMQLGENIHLIDRWDPSRALDIILESDIGAGTGASVFLASLLEHPRFT